MNLKMANNIFMSPMRQRGKKALHSSFRFHTFSQVISNFPISENPITRGCVEIESDSENELESEEKYLD
jgi:hypothetical protein